MALLLNPWLRSGTLLTPADPSHQNVIYGSEDAAAGRVLHEGAREMVRGRGDAARCIRLRKLQ